MIYGKKWSKISKELIIRNENSVKNRFIALTKFLKKKSKHFDIKNLKFRNQIKLIIENLKLDINSAYNENQNNLANKCDKKFLQKKENQEIGFSEEFTNVSKNTPNHDFDDFDINEDKKSEEVLMFIENSENNEYNKNNENNLFNKTVSFKDSEDSDLSFSSFNNQDLFDYFYSDEITDENSLMFPSNRNFIIEENKEHDFHLFLKNNVFSQTPHLSNEFKEIKNQILELKRAEEKKLTLFKLDDNLSDFFPTIDAEDAKNRIL